MADIARRVIQVTADQVIGPPRKKRNRAPKDPMAEASWLGPNIYVRPMSPAYWENAPTQQGFGHLDKIAREMKP